MATVATLDVKIGADIKSFQQGMAKMEGQLKQVGQNLRAVGGTLSRAITLPILGIGGAAIKAASDVEEMQAKFNTVFKNVGGDVSKQLGNFSKQVNRSRYDLQGMAATFGDIIKPMGFTEESAADMSVTLTKLAVDLSSFNNMPMDEAVRRLRGTLIGAHENAAEFGVIINENTLKQELMRMGADKLTGAQFEQAKVQARLNLLMAGTTDAQDDATRTAGSFANQMRGLHDSVRDLGVEIGQILLPFARDLVGRMSNLVSLFQTMSPEAKQFSIVVAGMAAAMGPLIFALGGISSGFASIFRVISMTMTLFNPYVAGMAAIAAIAVAIYRNWDAVVAALTGVYNYVKDFFGPVFEDLGVTIATAYEVIAGWWTDNGESVLTAIGVWLTAIGGVFQALWSGIKLSAESGLGLVQGVISTFFGEEGSITKMLSTVGGKILTVLGQAYVTALTLTTTNLNTISAAVGAWVAIGSGDWDTAWEKVKSVPSDKLDALRTIIQTWVGNAKTDLDTNNGKDLSDKIVGTDAGFNLKSYLSAAFASARNAALGYIFGASAPDGQDSLFGAIEKIEPLPLDAMVVNPPEVPEITLPEGYEDILNVIPDADETHRWGLFVTGMRELHLRIGDVEAAWRPLFGTDSPQWMKDLSKYASDATLIVTGLEAMVELLKPSTWTDAFDVLKDLGKGLWNIVTAIGEIILKIAQWVLVQAGIGGGGPDFTGGAPGISIPGSGGGATTTAGGSGAGLGLLGGATVGATLGIFGYGLGQMFNDATTSLIEQGVDPAQLGTATSLGGLLQGLGSMGSGGTPGWLSGLQGYMGTGGSANTSGIMGSGSMGSTQTININLDGQQIATATVPYMAGELELYGTNY